MIARRMAVLGWIGTILLELIAGHCSAQIIFNEGNAVSPTEGPGFLSTDLGKPYEGYDYGAIPHSGNTNLPNDAQTPGNPFAPDLSAAAGVQTSFVDGFDFNTNPRGFARIQYNGGNWIELAVTEDHTDLRGYTFYWQDNFDDDGTVGEIISQDGSLSENERGAVKFSQDQAWSNLRAGTIITIGDQDSADEVRDEYPFGFPVSDIDDTGHDYDLSTNLTFEPFDGSDDWHIHFFLDESVTLGATPASTEYFAANSDIEVSNEQWAGKLLGPSNNVIDQVQDPALLVFQMDVTTDARGEFIGEADSGVSPMFGAETTGTGVGDDEALALLSNPDSGETGAAYFEDLDWSTFGRPNLFNARNDVTDADGDGVTLGDIDSASLQDENTLGQVQDFSGLYDPVRANTYDWKPGNSDFAAASSWERANDNSTAASTPDTEWTARLLNAAGGDEVAEVNADSTVSFAEVSASSGTMTLNIAAGQTLTVDGDTQPGRVLVDDGGVLSGAGTIDAETVELFGGTAAPEAGMAVAGDYIQHTDAGMEIVIEGFGVGEFGSLAITGDAMLEGDLLISLADGFTPTTSATLEILSAASVVESLNLIGDTAGFSLIADGSSLTLEFTATIPPGDYNGDGFVNVADYTVWRDSLGVTGVGLPADGDGNEVVDAGDYQVWKNNFGTPVPASQFATVGVPEPATSMLALGSILVVLTGAKIRKRRTLASLP